MKKLKLICLAVILLVLFGCFGAPKYYEIEPRKNYNTYWLKGKKYVEIKNDSLAVTAVFQDIQDGKMAFFFKIVNYGNNVFDVKPAEFYCTFNQPVEDTIKTVKAIDPEIVIRNLKADINKRKKRLRDEQNLDTFTNLLDAILDISTKQTPKELKADEISDSTREIDQKLDYITAENQIKNLNQKHKAWSLNTLRRTTLPKQSSISGLVYFPFNAKANNFTIYLPLGTNIIDIVYQQKMMEKRKL